MSDDFGNTLPALLGLTSYSVHWEHLHQNAQMSLSVCVSNLQAFASIIENKISVVLETRGMNCLHFFDTEIHYTFNDDIL